MNKSCRFVSGILLAAGLAVAALPGMAQQRSGCGPGGGMNVFEDYENSPPHQKRLHDALKITPDQEAAWKKYIDAIQSAKASPRPQTDWSSLSAPDRVDKLVEADKRSLDQMTKQAEAMKTFYAVLTPEQKKTFDQFHGGARRGG